MKKLFIVLFTLVSMAVTAPVFADATETATSTENPVLYVDINNDSAEKIADLLSGVGLQKAQAIVDYRSEFGSFSAIEELLNVPGIGPATLEKNRMAIRIGDTEG